MESINQFMQLSIEEARQGVSNNHGGPFGAVIVQNNEIIAKNHNHVIETNDPTAHAEILVIREASQKLQRFDLFDCVLYTTCEPCPMCLSAIYWAKIKQVYYGCTKQDAAEIKFDDDFIYNEIKNNNASSRLKLEQINRAACLEPFKAWQSKTDKILY